MAWKEVILVCLITPFERLHGEMRKDQTLRANISLISAVEGCIICVWLSGCVAVLQE
jgi:hypothetical protein